MKHTEIRFLPHRRSYGVLGSQSETRIASALLRVQGFSPQAAVELEGMSGLRHRIPLLGVDNERKRIVVVQGGAEELSRFSHDRTKTPQTPGQPPPRTLEELQLEWMQRSLFKSYDLRQALQSRGWSCNVLYFFNSFETPFANMSEEEQAQWREASGLPRDVSLHAYGSHQPIAALDIDFIRARVISAGAGFIDANQLDTPELATLASPWCETTEPVASAVVNRLRVRQFLRPPLDELLLGTLEKAGQLPLDDLARAPELAQRAGHEIDVNSIATRVSPEDPIATLRQLESLGQVTFRRREVFIEPGGKAVAQEWERTAQESLFIKVLRELRLPELVEGMIRAIRGGSA